MKQIFHVRMWSGGPHYINVQRIVIDNGPFTSQSSGILLIFYKCNWDSLQIELVNAIIIAPNNRIKIQMT